LRYAAKVLFMRETVEVIAVLVTTFLTGVELSIAVFVHPVLSRIDDSAHAEAVKPLARLLGQVMPFWYPGALLSLIAVVLSRPYGTASWWTSLSSATLFAGSIVYSLVGPVPINTRVAAMQLDALPLDWKRDRRRWDQLHQIRVVVLMVASALLVIAVVT
jgi:uncharacterized membrane protein